MKHFRNFLPDFELVPSESMAPRTLKNSTFAILAGVMAAISIFSACMEEPIPYDLSNTDLYLDTLSVQSFEATTFQSPPEMGTISTLYLGQGNGFSNQYILIKLSNENTTKTLAMHQLGDSSFVIDSSYMQIWYDGDSIDITASFQLSYFPNAGDSLFGEYTSHYLDPSLSELSAMAVNIAQTMLVQDSVDTLLEEPNPPYLYFPISQSVIGDLADSTTANYTFMLTAVDSLYSRIGFQSREGGTATSPRLYIDYQYTSTDTMGVTTTDTTSSSFLTVADLSFTKPPGVAAVDSVNLTIGRANGFKSLLKLKIDSLDFPANTTIRKANISFEVNEGDSLDGFKVVGYPLESEPLSFSYQVLDEDSYTTSSSYFISGTVSDGHIVLDLKYYIHGIIQGKIQNYGIKLYSSITNNPFELLHLETTNPDSIDPVLKVQYVYP